MEPAMITLAGFLLAVVVQIIIGVWALRGMETGLIVKMQQMKDEIDLRLLTAIRERDLEMAAIRGSSGEVGHSLREKINQVELYVEREFISKQDFKLHIDLIRDQLSAMNSRMDVKFTSFEAKLDGLVTRRDV